jgi:transposase
MPQPVSDDQNSSHTEEIILGVDTHKDLHVAAVITSLGALRETTTFPATAAGYQALLAWAGTFGVLRRAGVECTGSYGAALARHLRAAGIEVIEVNQPDKAIRRRQGKTDSLDAQAAARAVLSGRASGSAKAGDGPVEMLRMFKLAKSSAIKARTQTINQLKALLVAADPALRETLSGLSNLRLIRRCAQLDIDTPQDTTSAAAYTLQLLARRILTLTDEISELEHQITTAVTSHTPQLLTRCGIGPDNAAAPQARPAVAASTAAVTVKPIPRSIASPCAGCAGMPAPATTSPAASRGQDPPRSHPLLKALHSPRNLSDHHIPTRNAAVCRLTSIGASVPSDQPERRHSAHIVSSCEQASGATKGTVSHTVSSGRASPAEGGASGSPFHRTCITSPGSLTVVSKQLAPARSDGLRSALISLISCLLKTSGCCVFLVANFLAPGAGQARGRAAQCAFPPSQALCDV